MPTPKVAVTVPIRSGVELSEDRPGAELSAADRYWRAQAAAVQRIFALLYPGIRIQYLFKALEGHMGTPDAVSIRAESQTRADATPAIPDPRERAISYLDGPYLGDVVAGGTRGTAPELTVVAPVPRDPEGLAVHERTAPVFHRMVAAWAVRAAPVLFEEAKYRYEMRLKGQRRRRHEFTPVRRVPARLQDAAPDSRDTSRPPAILIGFHWLETGGAEKLAFDCVHWARAAGLRVIVIADKPAPQRLAARLPEDPEVEFLRLDAYLPHGRLFEVLAALVRTENVRAIHIHHHLRLYDNLLKLKALFPDLQVIDSTHIVEHRDGGFPRTSGVWTRYIDHHHVISHDLRSFYLDEFNVSQKVRLGRMLAPDAAAVDPVLRLEAGQKRLRLAFVGRMVHQKRAPLVVEITRRLSKWARKAGIELQVDMVGTGAYLDVVRAMIRRAGLGGTITLHAPDADVPAILGRADILLLPSGNEGLALVCYEAIENGALPISTDVGGQRELVPAGLLVPPAPLRCISDTVARVQRLMGDPAFLADCKTQALARYRELRRDATAQEVVGALYRDIATEAAQ